MGTGCARLPEPELSAENVVSTPGSSGEEAVYAAPMHNYERYGNWENYIRIYKDRAYFQCQHQGCGIYYTSLGDEALHCLAEKVYMTDIYGSILFAHDATDFLAMDLEKGEEWVRLADRSRVQRILPVSNGETLYVFCIGEESSSRVLKIHLKTLETEEFTFPETVFRDILLDGDTLYYIRRGEEKVYWLCRAELQEKREEILLEADPNFQLYKVGDRLLCFDQLSDTLIYDLKTGETETFPYRDIMMMGNIAVSAVDDPWFYDVAFGKELTKEEIGVTQKRFTVFENGIANFELEGNTDRVELKVGENTCSFSMKESSFATFKANEYGAMILTKNYLYAVDWSTGTVTEYAHIT
ncbi:MAG: hypothetical protein IJ043_02705 [Clostridia bacterium]|nr:hypothetical protein [Clostridia bacterium]